MIHLSISTDQHACSLLTGVSIAVWIACDTHGSMAKPLSSRHRAKNSRSDKTPGATRRYSLLMLRYDTRPEG